MEGIAKNASAWPPFGSSMLYDRIAGRKQRIARALALAPGLITYGGKGPDEPVDSNRTEAGRARNRRVELMVMTKRTVILTDIRTTVETSGATAVATLGLRPGEEWPQEKKAEDRKNAKNTSMPEYTAEWLDTAPSGFRVKRM